MINLIKSSITSRAFLIIILPNYTVVPVEALIEKITRKYYTIKKTNSKVRLFSFFIGISNQTVYFIAAFILWNVFSLPIIARIAVISAPQVLPVTAALIAHIVTFGLTPFSL